MLILFMNFMIVKLFSICLRMKKCTVFYHLLSVACISSITAAHYLE